MLHVSLRWEIVDYLLFHCKFAHTLWREVFLAFGIQWVMSSMLNCFSLFSSFSFFLAWRNWLGKHKTPVKYLEYGPNMLNMVSLVRNTYTFRSLKDFYLVLCISEPVSGVLCNVLLFLIF